MENKGKLKGLNRMSWFLSYHRVPVLIIILIITGIFLYGAFKIRGEIILGDMFPYDHPYPKLHARFAQVFGTGASMSVIAIRAKHGDIFNKRTLTKIKALTEEVLLSEEFYRILVVSIARNSTKIAKPKAKGEIAFDCLMFPNVPENDQEMEELKKNIFSTPSIKGMLVSEDGTAALIMAEMKEDVSYEKVFHVLRAFVTKYTDQETSIHIVGYPMLMGWIYSLKPQIFHVFMMSIIGMIVVLIVIFYGNFLGMIVVMGNCLITTVWGLGFIGFTGVNFSPMMYVLAFLVGARMVGNAHQITYRYYEELHSSGHDRLTACYQTMRSMIIPNASAVAADVAGFAVLFIAKIALMRDVATIMTFWMVTILLTGFLVPAIASLIPFKTSTERWAKERCHTDWLARVMMAITRFAIGPVSRYACGSIIIVFGIFCFWQTSKLKIGDPTPGSPIFYSDQTFNKDTALIDRLFSASSDNLTLYYEGAPDSVYDPEVATTFEKFDKHMAKTLPDIYKTSTSIISPAKMVNMVFHDGDVGYYQLPSTQEGVVAMFGMVTSKLSAVARRAWMDETAERSNINLFFSDHTSGNLLRIREAAYDFFKNHPMKLEKGQFLLAGGRVGMEIALNEEIKRSHILIDLTVYAAIFIVCSLTFMSLTAGLVLTFPLILANSVAAAYMSLTNIGLSINTLPVAAIGAGVGVDFAIYLYFRTREEFAFASAAGGIANWYEIIVQSMCTCGKAVVYTGFTIIVPIITWYFFSDMKFQSEVGFFLSMIMATNVILTLIFHPMVIYIKPKFLRRKVSWVQ